jgi:hypothetical protein
MDCITTVVGILYFGAVEVNPFLARVTNTNLAAFVAIKITTTMVIALMFNQADKILMRTQNKNTASFKRIRYVLKASYVGATAFLLFAVANNIISVTRVI